MPHNAFNSCEMASFKSASVCKIDWFAIFVCSSVYIRDSSGIRDHISFIIAFPAFKRKRNKWLCVKQMYLSRCHSISLNLDVRSSNSSTRSCRYQAQQTCLIFGYTRNFVMISHESVYLFDEKKRKYMQNKRCGKHFNDEREW